MHKSGLIELEAVLAVARRQGFRAAATELDMSTTAVSHAVAGLEARLGTRLFHRTTRSVALTEAGRRFVAQIAPAVAGIRDAMAAVGDSGATLGGTLRINSSLGAALMTFRPLMAEFMRRHPGVTLDIVTEGRMVDIVAEGFDAGLRLASMVPRDMVRVPLGGSLRMAVVATPGYLETRTHPGAPSDLMQHDCIRARLPSGVPSAWEFAEGGRPISLDVPGPLVLDAPMLMREAVLVGLGIAQLAEWYVGDDLAAGRLVRVLDEWALPAPGLCLYYAGNRHLPAALRALVDLVHEMRAVEAHRDATRRLRKAGAGSRTVGAKRRSGG